jgi:hypothetical protein
MEPLLSTSKSVPPRRTTRRGWWLALAGLVIWISADLFVPRHHDLRQFDPNELAQVETAMWRSYYEKKPVLLFWQLAGGLRQQFHAPFWRSFKIGFQATKAAFVFKKGRSRADYEQALPDLIAYYESIQDLSTGPFDVVKVSKLELEWWIVHRQRDRYSYADLAEVLAQTAATQYDQPAAQFKTYGFLRADAMRLRDESSQKTGGTTEADISTGLAITA